MSEKSKRPRRQFGFFWFALLAGALFTALAPIRLYFKPESTRSALIFAGVCAVGIALTIAVAAIFIQWACRQRSFRWILLGLACVGALSPLLVIPESEHETTFQQVMLFALGRSALVALFLVFTAAFVRWLCRWRNLRWFVALVAGIAALTVAFYVVENRRGKQAWENYKLEWEAKGEKFDLLSYTPPPVPDDQNFALTPIVASCYRARLNGTLLRIDDGPDDTNNRIAMHMERSENEAVRFYPTNAGGWQRGRLFDLLAWQTYYRVTAFTNVEETYVWDGETNGKAIIVSSNVVVIPLEFPIAPQPQSPAADVLLALSKFDSAIEELRTASRLPQARFPLRYDSENPADILVPHLTSLKYCAQVLQLHAIAELQLDHTEQALADVELMLRLVDSLQNEPLLISQLVRLTMWQLALQPVWEGLAEHRWSDAQLARLEQDLQRLDFISSYQLALRGERGYVIKLIDYSRTHCDGNNSMAVFLVYSVCPGFFDWIDDHVPQWFGEIISPLVPDKLMGRAARRLPPDGWYYWNNVAAAESIRLEMLPFFDTVKRFVPVGATTNVHKTLPEWYEKRRSPYDCLARMMTPVTSRTAVRFAHAQASADMARLACALERHRLAHGDYPDMLDALLPRFIEQIPHDIIHGQPLKYRRVGDGQFALYSVGWNEVDDGGVVENVSTTRRINLENGDWVWWSSANPETLPPMLPASE